MTVDINDNIAFARLMARKSSTQQAKICFTSSLMIGSFSVRIRIETFRSDTQINQIKLKELIEPKFIDKTITLMYSSYIEISDEIYESIADYYPNRDIEITISNGENSVSVSYSNTRRM